MCLQGKRHVYTVFLQLFTGLKALPSSAIDFEVHVNANGHWVS